MFDLIRSHKPLATAVHCAFDLIELDGEDVRRQRIEARKALLVDLLHGAHSTRRDHLRASSLSGSARYTARGDRHIG
ncbi:MAG TPA: hypothetical protein VIJ04_10370 [Xanthobacteraceae bacterium]